MHTERPLSIIERATILIDEYTKMIGDVFPGVITTDEFIQAFNQFFIHYQESKKLKLAPRSLQERKISCTSAAALMGLWHELLGNSAAHYLIQVIEPHSGTSKSSAHSLVGLRADDHKVPYFHYTTKYGLGPVTPTYHFESDMITGTKAYLVNRLRVMSVRTANLRTASNP